MREVAGKCLCRAINHYGVAPGVGGAITYVDETMRPIARPYQVALSQKCGFEPKMASGARNQPVHYRWSQASAKKCRQW